MPRTRTPPDVVLRPIVPVQPSRPLGNGTRVALVAPAGPLANAGELARALDNARTLGWEPRAGRSVLDRHGYFAGTDEARLADLQRAIEDDSIDAIWCLRGGYGAMRLLHRLDVECIARANKPLLGYSDVTALHALWQHAGVLSYHGPTARSAISPFSLQSLVATVTSSDEQALVADNAMTLRRGVASGRLAGGNLALVAALCGTPFQIDFRDAIVVLEDIGEAVYRIDRMLVQLRLAGAFDGCTALAFGQFTDCPDTTDDGSRSLREVAHETADALGVPAIFQVPVGHVDDQWTLPFGARATLDAGARTVTVHARTSDPIISSPTPT